MGLLERYKKPGGFVQLLGLLETCTPQKRDKFLSMIREESPIWEAELRLKILSVDRIFTWPIGALTELLSRLQNLTIAVLYSSFEAERQGEMAAILNFEQNKHLKLIIQDRKFSLSEVNVSMEKLLIETRSLITQGIIRLDKIDPELEIYAEIEDHLNANKAVDSISQKETDLNKSLKPTGLDKLVINQVGNSEVRSSKVGNSQLSNSQIGSSKTDNTQAASNQAGNTQIGSSDKQLQDELKKTKEKMQSLIQENLTLKREHDILKDKLERIKKIA